MNYPNTLFREKVTDYNYDTNLNFNLKLWQGLHLNRAQANRDNIDEQRVTSDRKARC